MTLIDFSIRIICAFVFGTVIGFERQYRQKYSAYRMAGIRTNALVCIGACLFVMFSILDNTYDKTRIAAQVVSGIGFLCGGVILKEGINIRGLNTAATIWCTASIGVLVSEGFILYAAVGTILILFINIVLRPLGKKIHEDNYPQSEDIFCYEIRVKCMSKEELHIRSLLMHMVKDEDFKLKNLESQDTKFGDKVNIKAAIVSSKKNDIGIEKIINRISLEAGVLSIVWEIL